MWRKNRAPNDGSSQGVDLNRNYPDHWGSDNGSSGRTYSDTYRGPKAISEPETRALIAAFRSFEPRIVGAIDLHSYSQLLLRPYGWTDGNSPDEAAFVKLGQLLYDTIKADHGTEYVSERSNDLYAVSGAASDWFYGAGVNKNEHKNYGITIELSPSADDPDGWGFVLPPDQIIGVGQEIFKAIKVYADFCLKNPLGIQA